MSLPVFQTEDRVFQMFQDKWSAQIDPILEVPLTNGRQLSSVSLVSGSNVVNHGLGAKLQGWVLTRKRQWLSGGTPTVYDVSDTQDNNSQPSLTLQLYCTQGTGTNPVLVDLWVY